MEAFLEFLRLVGDPVFALSILGNVYLVKRSLDREKETIGLLRSIDKGQTAAQQDRITFATFMQKNDNDHAMLKERILP